MVLARLLPPKTSALFIDFDNAAGLFPKQQFVQRISNWLKWLEDGRFDPKGRRRKFIEKRVYWHPTNGGQAPAFEHHGFACETCVYETAGKKGMSAVDINLAMDAIDVANKRKQALQEIVILASDSDYVSLIERLKKKGIQTCIVVSSRDVSVISYTGRADLVIPDEKLAEAADYVSGRKKAAVPTGTAPAVAVKAAAPAKPARGAPAKSAAPAPAPASTASKLDLPGAAKIVEELAEQQGGPVGRDKVMTRLIGKRVFPAAGLCGKASYREFAEAIVKLRPQLGMLVYANGKTVSIYRKRRTPSDAKSA